jgi:hypothetical protein
MAFAGELCVFSPLENTAKLPGTVLFVTSAVPVYEYYLTLYKQYEYYYDSCYEY